ncbi:MAG: hypothetical protein SGI92_01330 [Bryobacteraceae bacterium]|nr:hypothetical protein [Bryobacteraceae bacterium]
MGLELESWDEKRLLSMVRDLFGVEVDSFSEQHVLELRLAVDQAQGRYALQNTWTNGQVQHALMWHYGFWRLRQLRDRGGLSARDILPPGLYPDVAVVIAKQVR